MTDTGVNHRAVSPQVFGAMIVVGSVTCIVSPVVERWPQTGKRRVR